MPLRKIKTTISRKCTWHFVDIQLVLRELFLWMNFVVTKVRAELSCRWNKKNFTLGHTKAKLLQKDFLVLSLFHAYYLCVIKKTFKLLSVLLYKVWKDESHTEKWKCRLRFFMTSICDGKFLDKVFMLPQKNCSYF